MRRPRFLPSGISTPVLPPTEESTCASRVVGIWHSETPRRKVAAAKPVMSPTTPAAERDDEILARHAVREQVVIDALDGRETLVLLAGRDDGVRHGQRELLLELFEVERRDGRVRDDVDAARRKSLADNGRRAGEQSAFDMDFGHAVRALQSQQFRHGDSSLGIFLRGGPGYPWFPGPFLPG